MDVPPLGWALAILGILALLLFDFLFHVRTAHFASYLTEKALSVDNLFVFLIIMASFKVPRADQQKALLFGIVFSLLARTVLIFLGAALVNSYAFVFYIFGLILLGTAGQMLKPGTARADRRTTSSSASPGGSCGPLTPTTATDCSPSTRAAA
jgi:tellurite resistance protein TerC